MRTTEEAFDVPIQTIRHFHGNKKHDVGLVRWRALACVLTDNHNDLRLLIETPDPNLIRYSF